MTEYIGFTGHRDRITHAEELDRIRQLHPGAVWVHGGAKGFDAQVDRYATEHGIECRVIRPDYSLHPPNVAPLFRNEKIVNMSSIVYACYDGRTTGGTYHAINYAKSQGKRVVFLSSIDIPEDVNV